MKRFNFLSIFIFVFILQSCVEDEGIVDFSTQPLEDYSDAYLVLNEGNFSDGVGSVSYLKSDLSTFRQKVFQTINGTPVGSVLQSGIVSGNQIYLVVNNSNKIEVVDRISLKSVATITSNLSNPRYAVVTNGKLYVSNWGASFDGTGNYVAVFDAITKAYITSVTTSTDGVIERIYTVGSLVYVLNTGFGSGSKVSVIDTSDDTLEAEITLSTDPNSAVVIGSDLYVLCGKGDSTEPTNDAEIWKITGTTKNKIIDFTSLADVQTASYLNAIGSDFYFVLTNDGEKDIYTLPMNGDVAREITEVIDLSGIAFLYDFTILNDQLIISDALDSKTPGIVTIYDKIGNKNGSFTFDIGPGHILYNPPM